VTSGTSKSGSRSGGETSRSTVRRLRSAFFLWRSSIRGRDILAAAVLVALSVAAGAFLYARARTAARLDFAQRAQGLGLAVTDRLSLPVDDLRTLQRFFEASNGVTRRQFRMLTGPMLLNRRFVHAFEWLPAVPASGRSAYEAEARLDGLLQYRFWEAAADGAPREVSPRRGYAPIHYMEPPNAAALGFDVASDPARWATAEKARDTGSIAASPPFQLLEDARGTPPAVALYAPLYAEGDPGSAAERRRSIAGFVLAIVRVSPLVEGAASAAGAGLGFTLHDRGAGGKSPLIATRPPDAAALPRRAGLHADFSVPFEGRKWDLSVFALPRTFLPAKRGAIEVASLGALAALLLFVTATSLRTISRLRRQVEKVGPYRLIARLGHGAMGVVWEARHALLRRPTAVKLLAPGTEGERALARFEREVQLTAGLTHPSTIAIYDYGRASNGVFYYAMELLRGINLLQLVGFDGPLPRGRVVHLLRQACGALAEAHAAGLIHRDIKPANLMICVYGGIPDFLKVLDFGLVKDIGAGEPLPEAAAAIGDGDAGLSQDGSLLGTPLYMAPEAMSDPAKVDVRADVFALGAVGYFLLTGASPFPGRTALEVFAREHKGAPPLPGGALEETIHRCLSFARVERPASAEALDALLEACTDVPAWTRGDARAWWQEKGAAALATARAERVERGGEVLVPSPALRSRD
jgi:CHASE1-domain containing sensor protein